MRLNLKKEMLVCWLEICLFLPTRSKTRFQIMGIIRINKACFDNCPKLLKLKTL
jgi:hypothetical protein